MICFYFSLDAFFVISLIYILTGVMVARPEHLHIFNIRNSNVEQNVGRYTIKISQY